MDKVTFSELMAIEEKEEIGFTTALQILMDNGLVVENEVNPLNGKITFHCNISDLLESDVDSLDILRLKGNGWVISGDKFIKIIE